MTVGPVESALQEALRRGEQGVQVAVYQHGKLIVDAWAGEDGNGGAVDGRTMFPVFSMTKAVTAVAVHILADRGVVDLESPVATYWPEFAAHGKSGITVRHVLSHQSGVPQMPDGVTPEKMADWDWMTHAIEDCRPAFPPGTKGAYQSLVFGWLVGEVVQRADPHRRPFGAFVRDEICRPLGIEDLWIGLPDGELARAARLSGEGREDVVDPTELYLRTFPAAVAPGPEVHNLRIIRQACLPGAGGIMSARAAARVFALLANRGEWDGTRLLASDTVESMLTPRPHSQDLDLTMYGGNRIAPPIGIGGLWLGHGLLGAGPSVLCHSGAGGSIGWSDLDTHVAIAICHNRMFDFNVTSQDVSGHPFLPLRDAIRSAVRD